MVQTHDAILFSVAATVPSCYEEAKASPASSTTVWSAGRTGRKAPRNATKGFFARTDNRVHATGRGPGPFTRPEVTLIHDWHEKATPRRQVRSTSPVVTWLAHHRLAWMEPYQRQHKENLFQEPPSNWRNCLAGILPFWHRQPLEMWKKINACKKNPLADSDTPCDSSLAVQPALTGTLIQLAR